MGEHTDQGPHNELKILLHAMWEILTYFNILNFETFIMLWICPDEKSKCPEIMKK